MKHPYASLLLIDFMLGKEGQAVFSKAGLFPARPDVAPDPVVAKVDPNIAKVPVNFILGSTIDKMEKRSDEIYQELFR